MKGMKFITVAIIAGVLLVSSCTGTVSSDIEGRIVGKWYEPERIVSVGVDSSGRYAIVDDEDFIIEIRQPNGEELLLYVLKENHNVGIGWYIIVGDLPVELGDPDYKRPVADYEYLKYQK